jgi:site-specific DNA recombinase
VAGGGRLASTRAGHERGDRRRIFIRDGGRWGIGQLHRILTRTTYIGRHEFNKRSKVKELKPASEIVTVDVPPLIDQAT